MDFFDTFPFTRLQGKNRGLDWVLQKIAEFQKAIDNIPEAVKSLTAKDLNAAPDGYGLGVYGVALLDAVDANECKQIGWYKLSSATLNGIGAPALMRTDGYSVKHVVQTAFSGDASADSFIIKQRICKGGVWGAWESVRSNNWLPTIAEIGAAPAGYGLGDKNRMQTLYDWNGINGATAPGWYNVTLTLNGISPWSLRVDTEGTNIFQEYKAIYNGIETIVHRTYAEGVWGEFEWENPPVISGIEYRTTERMNGKPVYCKYIDGGYLPNTGSKTYTIAANAEVFHVFGPNIPSVNFGGVIPPTLQTDNVISCFVVGNTVQISCGGDRSSISFYFIAKYTKTTD